MYENKIDAESDPFFVFSGDRADWRHARTVGLSDSSCHAARE
jgi:hypothetical protein